MKNLLLILPIMIEMAIQGNAFSVHNNQHHSSLSRLISEPQHTSIPPSTKLFMKSSSSRREAMVEIITSTTLISSIVTSTTNNAAYAKAEVAVGSAEKLCRERGDCLETGEWDGAVGWNWGAKDRCDASDPKCGVNGQLFDDDGQGTELQVPDTLDLKITKIIEMELLIGKKTETGTIRFGLYGNNCSASVEQFIRFVSNNGLTTNKELILSYNDILSSPISFAKSGTLRAIYPNEKLDFGILSQETAFVKNTGLTASKRKYSKQNAGTSFQPQPRPSTNIADVIKEEVSPRLHNAPGLISIPSKGLGYNNELLTNDDKAYESAFQITTSSNNSIEYMDTKEKRKVIGQILDKESMKFLSRLSSIPTQKGLKGIANINYGPPLIRVTLTKVSILDDV